MQLIKIYFLYSQTPIDFLNAFTYNFAFFDSTTEIIETTGHN